MIVDGPIDGSAEPEESGEKESLYEEMVEDQVLEELRVETLQVDAGVVEEDLNAAAGMRAAGWTRITGGMSVKA